MHFTLWPSLHATKGGYANVSWEDLRAMANAPLVSPAKKALQGWSPAKFGNDGPRKRENVVAVSCLVLDVDSGGHALAAVTAALAGIAGIAHSSWSHGHLENGTPDASVRKWRAVLALSRDITDAEHGRLWAAVAARVGEHGIALDRSTRTDASRFWFVPGVRAAGAPYEWADLPGAPIDVDAWLAAASISNGHPPIREEKVQSHAPQSAATSREDSAALALGRAWPARGRHEAQLALAGALRGEGWPADRALEFLCAVCRAAGDEDRPKRQATIEHTYARAADAPTTGWTRLSEHVPAIIVDAVRREVGGEAPMLARIAERLAQTRARNPELLGINSVEGSDAAAPGNNSPIIARIPTALGNPVHVLTDDELAAPMAPLSYLVRELGLVSGGGAPHLVAGYGFSGKTLAMQAMLLALAAGLPVWGVFPIARPLRVLHVDLEQGDLTRRRYQRLAGAMGADLRALGGRLGVAVMPRLKLEATEARWIDLMEGRDVVLVDSLRAARGGKENESEFREALDLLGTISDATGCRALVIHHAKKPGTDDVEARYSIRGSSAIYDAIDSGYVFSGARGEPVRIEHVKARAHGELEVDRALKVEDVPGGGDPKWGLRVSCVSTELLAAARAARETEHRMARASADAAAVRTVLMRSPGIGTRELIESMSAEGVSKARALAAVASMNEEIVKDEVVVNHRLTCRHWLKK